MAEEKKPVPPGPTTATSTLPKPTSSSTTSLPDPSTVGQVPPIPTDGVSITGAVDLINTESWSNVHKAPCARQALLTGIGSGFAFGGVRMVLRASAWNASNWAVGMFCLTSAVVWEACRWRRGNERDGVVRAMQIMEYKQMEREKKMEERREQLRLKKEEEERLRKEAEKRWWKPWG